VIVQTRNHTHPAMLLFDHSLSFSQLMKYSPEKENRKIREMEKFIKKEQLSEEKKKK